MTKCYYCNNTSEFYPYSNVEKKCVSVCKYCYCKLKPSWLDIYGKEISKYMKCVFCGTFAKRTIKHHVNYFPEQIVLVCVSCHNRIHKGDLSYLCPPDYDKEVFYQKT